MIRCYSLLVVTVTVIVLKTTEGRVVGFHVDDESCSGLVKDNQTAQIIKCAAFFASLANLSATLRADSVGLPAPLRMAVDAGTAWVCPNGAKGCFNLTFNGTSKSVAEHVVDLSDEIIIMDYDRSATQVYSRAEPYLSYADKIGKKSSVSVGLAIADSDDKNPASWKTRNETELETLMVTVLPSLSRHPSFNGFAVFTEGTWYSYSKFNVTPMDMDFQQSGVWYIDHKVVLDETLRDAWLIWAATRSINMVYIAPHAGADALIWIPGVEGSKENNIKFCNFIHLAEKQRIDVQLISDPKTDMEFIRNCSKQQQ